MTNNLSVWQLIVAAIGVGGTIIIAIILEAVRITRKITEATTEIKNLEERVDKIEDNVTYIQRLYLEQAFKVAAERVRGKRSSREKTTVNNEDEEEDEQED